MAYPYERKSRGSTSLLYPRDLFSFALTRKVVRGPLPDHAADDREDPTYQNRDHIHAQHLSGVKSWPGLPATLYTISHPPG
jgi:hypothetical protein